MEQEKFKLTIMANSIVSTDSRFTEDDLSLGRNYRPVAVYFQPHGGGEVTRKYNSNEVEISNLTLPRLVFQIFEKDIVDLSDKERMSFPTCYYRGIGDIKGIYNTEEEYTKSGNPKGCGYYTGAGGVKFFFHSYYIFSTVIFAKECLKRFGSERDKIVLEYKEKVGQEKNITDRELKDDAENIVKEINNPYSKRLLESRNIIFRGAPGTGKTYLAKQIAADIISNGHTKEYNELTEEQKSQIEFVQFHPSYDYSDFVEGLRPKMNEDGTMGFELQDGIFKKFVDIARRNFEDSRKTIESIEKEVSVQTEMKNFFDSIEYGVTVFKTVTGNEFTITDIDEVKNRIYIEIPGNKTVNKLILNINELRMMLESGLDFKKISDITSFFKKQFATQGYSYDFVLFREIRSRNFKAIKTDINKDKLKKYVFIIDEINRGEISKIFGELFFAIDPEYRGELGAIMTQYANMHVNPDEKFYIPENVYIIGTMNDIDRSVEAIDFAMRRRFRFIEVKVKDTQEDILDLLENENLKKEAVQRMDRLNEEILKVEDLNENYQIGASYFLKLNMLTFDELWTDCICPLLHEYIHGLYDEEDIIQKLKKAYGYVDVNSGNVDELDKN